jgi:hypothetical protein
MSLQLKQLASKSLLTMSNDEKVIYGVHNIEIDGINCISFKYDDIVPLQIAENNIESSTFSNIINSCEGIIKNNLIPELANYKNAERLKVYIKETEKYFIVISLGEYQPTLYKIYIEGIFEKVPSNLFL